MGFFLAASMKSACAVLRSTAFPLYRSSPSDWMARSIFAGVVSMLFDPDGMRQKWRRDDENDQQHEHDIDQWYHIHFGHRCPAMFVFESSECHDQPRLMLWTTGVMAAFS